MRISLGFSPCPNDTFTFYALTHERVAIQKEATGDPPLRFDVRLDDVEALNQLALVGALDVTKLSYHAYGHVADRYVMLGSGGALGQGVGPLIVTREPLADLAGRTVATPGGLTTANLLLGLSQPDSLTLHELRYDRIMPAVAAGEVDAGLIIHESRFTYPSYGLHLHLDLGVWWERDTGGLPLPLGGIAARRSLGAPLLQALEAALRNSLDYAYAQREEAQPYIAAHAQELSREVTDQHIGLYVNRYSYDLGDSGRNAVRTLLRRAEERGFLHDLPATLFASELVATTPSG